MVYEQLAEALGTSLAQFVATATEYLPNMLAALLLIATGWLLGSFVDASLRRLIHGREGRTAGPRARQLLVDWDAAKRLFRRVVPRNAPALISATRTAHLRSALVEEVRRAG